MTDVATKRSGARFAAWTLAALVTSACGKDTVQSRTIVEEYVALLGEARFADAMALRCSDRRFEDTDADQFLNEVERIEASAGAPLEAVSVEAVVDGRLRPPVEREPHREFRFRLRTETGASDPIHVVTVIEDDEERLCGYATEQTFELPDRLAEMSIEATQRPIDDVQDVVEGIERRFTGTVANAGEGGQSNETTEPVVEGWSTFWRTGDFGGVTVSLLRFADATSATRAASEMLRARVGDGTDLFELTGNAGAVGLRHRASAWTWVQPTDLGVHVDIVVAVYDDVVVWIGVSPVSADDDHATVAAVVAEVDAAVA